MITKRFLFSRCRVKLEDCFMTQKTSVKRPLRAHLTHTMQYKKRLKADEGRCLTPPVLKFISLNYYKAGLFEKTMTPSRWRNLVSLGRCPR